uniref:Uncharacterized protein n=1 Tax=Quercus lobata TaxID=97700 RepID=A0A7N2KQ56_QUELO
MRPPPVQRQEGEFSGIVVDRTGEGEAIMEIENSGDDINSKSVTNSKFVTDKERESEAGNVLNQEKPNLLFSESISENNCHDHLFPQSHSKNKCQGDLFLSQLLVIEKEIRKFDTTGTKEAGHMSTSSNEGEREKIHKFPHEVARKINATTCSLSPHCSTVEAAFMDFKEVLLWMIKTKQNIEWFLVMIWSIWTYRILVKTNQPWCNPNQLANMAKKLLTEFQVVQQASQP